MTGFLGNASMGYCVLDIIAAAILACVIFMGIRKRRALKIRKQEHIDRVLAESVDEVVK